MLDDVGLDEAQLLDLLGLVPVMGQPVPESFSDSTLLRGGRASRERLREMLKGVDASIMLPGANPGQPVYAAIQDLR